MVGFTLEGPRENRATSDIPISEGSELIQVLLGCLVPSGVPTAKIGLHDFGRATHHCGASDKPVVPFPLQRLVHEQFSTSSTPSDLEAL